MNSALIGGLILIDPPEAGILTSYMKPYRVYYKTSDLTCPNPVNEWVFMDESMYSLNDGFLQMNPNMPGDYPDVPAAYDCKGNCLSFSDGHVEFKKWMFFSNKNFQIVSFTVHNLLRYTSRLFHETEAIALRDAREFDEMKSGGREYIALLGNFNSSFPAEFLRAGDPATLSCFLYGHA